MHVSVQRNGEPYVHNDELSGRVIGAEELLPKAHGDAGLWSCTPVSLIVLQFCGPITEHSGELQRPMARQIAFNSNRQDCSMQVL